MCVGVCVHVCVPLSYLKSKDNVSVYISDVTLVAFINVVNEICTPAYLAVCLQNS